MRLIAGPCQHESYEMSLDICKQLYLMCTDMGIDYTFKASFDKANRTSLKGKRGICFDETMNDFGYIKTMFSNLDETISIGDMK